jgi:hypothetical protein
MSASFTVASVLNHRLLTINEVNTNHSNCVNKDAKANKDSHATVVAIID